MRGKSVYLSVIGIHMEQHVVFPENLKSVDAKEHAMYAMYWLLIVFCVFVISTYLSLIYFSLSCSLFWCLCRSLSSKLDDYLLLLLFAGVTDRSNIQDVIVVITDGEPSERYGGYLQVLDQVSRWTIVLSVSYLTFVISFCTFSIKFCQCMGDERLEYKFS